VGTWWSGQEHRVLSGIDGVLLVVVIGDGKLAVPVDFAIRRPENGYQRAAAHTGMEAPLVNRVLFSDLEALVGDRRLPGAQ
jgi:hypothetical protein